MRISTGRILAAAALVAALAVPGVPKAGAEKTSFAFADGNKLLAMCEASDTEECRGFVAAVSDGMGMANANPTEYAMGGWRACVPAQVTIQQVVDVVVAFLREHPAVRHLGAFSLSAGALAEAFPCQ